MQPSLRFGFLNLCTPANGLDGYELTRHNMTKPDYIEISIPGTSGRIKQITGTGNTDSTSLKVEFSCQSNFGSASALYDFIENVEQTVTDTQNNLQQVEFGLLDAPSTFTVDNCDMEFEFSKVWKSDDGWWLDYKVQFNQWGR